MLPTGRKRIAVLGAGPIGLEAALYGSCLGHEVRVYERGAIGENIRSWGHVRLFSPWSFERSRLAERRLAQAGVELAPGDVSPTGHEYVERYLEPLARTLLGDRVSLETRVVGIGREGLGRDGAMGAARRDHPFRILLEDAGGERVEDADAVLDCTGTYGNANWLGSGNLPALGERELASRISYTIEDVGGARRAHHEGRHVLVVGSGYSAATTILALTGLDRTRITWVARCPHAAPYRVIDGDPFPERARLARRANELACESDERVRYLPGAAVLALGARGEGFEARVRHASGEETIACDRIVGLVGYGPDRAIYEQIQLHECYATLSPMRLAAARLSRATGNCLDETPHGAETLVNPEPDFYVLGAKSYGLGSDFLVRLGLEQVREVYTLLAGRGDLDLYVD